ncbi:MAG: methanogenesis marker 9 domain-containing protein [Methanoregulaceae archaeon]|nr:methanogenesis marker 9 domain-containing protein [Methanoregulaceae archaeon]MCU0627980.1 methanogenesis marker 9 domain-containing protein [Methanoregulaceae archaeon]
MENNEYFQRFGIVLNRKVVKTPIAIASMAGWVDANYVLARKAHVGVAFIGGYSIDEKTLEASHEMAKQGRKEFLCDDPLKELEDQSRLLEGSDVVTGINLRGSSEQSYQDITRYLGDRVIYEIDAHCRQEPMIRAGCGEYYLHHPDELARCIKALKSEDVTVSVKIRAGVHANDAVLAASLWKAGADIIHIDLMDFGYQKIRQIRNSCPLFIIANNSMHTFERVKEMFSHGADMVSLARKSDERTLGGLDAAISRYADEHGWYNSPKQLCRGGDLRALTFCCMPVKNCPLIPTLEKLGITREEYMAIKQEYVRGTPLSEGKQTCFGSLAWCCKDSSPCMFRDLSIRQAGLSNGEYMRKKREISDKLMHWLFYERAKDNVC